MSAAGTSVIEVARQPSQTDNLLSCRRWKYVGSQGRNYRRFSIYQMSDYAQPLARTAILPVVSFLASGHAPYREAFSTALKMLAVISDTLNFASPAAEHYTVIPPDRLSQSPRTACRGRNNAAQVRLEALVSHVIAQSRHSTTVSHRQ